MYMERKEDGEKDMTIVLKFQKTVKNASQHGISVIRYRRQHDRTRYCPVRTRVLIQQTRAAIRELKFNKAPHLHIHCITLSGLFTDKTIQISWIAYW
jgi:hypothetical protein